MRNIELMLLSIHCVISIFMMLDAVSIPFHQRKSHRLTHHSRSFHEFYRRYIGLPVCAKRNICMRHKLLTSSRGSNDTAKRISGIEFHHSLTFAQPHEPWKCHEIAAYAAEQKRRIVEIYPENPFRRSIEIKVHLPVEFTKAKVESWILSES